MLCSLSAPSRTTTLENGGFHLNYSIQCGSLVREGLTLAIVGRPTWARAAFSRLLERNRAIVTDIPGTTRDLNRIFSTFCIGK